MKLQSKVRTAHRTGCSTVLAARKEAWVVGAASASPAARCIRPPATTSRATCEAWQSPCVTAADQQLQ